VRLPVTPAATARVRLVVLGRVQGVGFRWFVLQQARALELDGRVANRADGAVEVEAQGTRDRLEQLVALVGLGPSGARVEEVRTEWLEGTTIASGFRIEDSRR